MDDGEHSRYHSLPVSSSIHKNRKLRKLRRSFNAVLPVVRLLKSMKRLCVDPAAVQISTRKRKARENLNTSDQHEYPGHLTLKFSNNISGPIYTGLPIGDQEGRTLDLLLIDSLTQNTVNSGPEASAKVEIAVVEKDFTSFGGDKSLIRGDPHVSLKDGRVSVSHISLKHTRVPLKNHEVRLVARVVYPHDIGARIVEAVTEPFFVKDRRAMGKSRKPLFLDDQVWKLQNIAKTGAFHNRLTEENILTVRDFLTNYFLNRENLLKILGRRMPGKKLDAAVNQAKGKLDLKRYVYLHENSRVVFTDVGELIGVNEEGQFLPVEQLTQIQKDFGIELVKRVFHGGHQNFKVLLDDDCFQMPFPSSSPNKAADLDGSNNYPADTQQLQPAPDNIANYMPSTSLTNNYNYINPNKPHLLDPDDDDFIYQVLPPGIWD